jgi:hypothetical protein
MCVSGSKHARVPSLESAQAFSGLPSLVILHTICCTFGSGGAVRGVAVALVVGAVSGTVALVGVVSFVGIVAFVGVVPSVGIVSFVGVVAFVGIVSFVGVVGTVPFVGIVSFVGVVGFVSLVGFVVFVSFTFTFTTMIPGSAAHTSDRGS